MSLDRVSLGQGRTKYGVEEIQLKQAPNYMFWLMMNALELNGGIWHQLNFSVYPHFGV